MGSASTGGAPEGMTMIRLRGSAARSATVRIGVGVSCQLVLVLPPPGARTALGLATSRLYSPISFSRLERNSSSAAPPPYTRTLLAPHSLRIPVGPHTCAPCDHDCSSVKSGIPLEP